MQFWEPYVFSGSFTSTMAAFTALEFYTILYAVGHGKKKERLGETTKKYCIKAHNVNLCCNCFIWSFLVEADKARGQLTFSSGAFVTLLPGPIPLVCLPAFPRLSSWLLPLRLKRFLSRNLLPPRPQRGLYGPVLLQLIRAGFPPGRHQAGHSSETSHSQDFSIAIFSLSGGPQGGERGKKGPGDEATPKMERAALFAVWRSSQSSTEGAPLRQILLGSPLVQKILLFFFFFNINKCTPGKSFSSLPPSLHANVKGCAKAFPIINHQESRKSAAETTKAALAAAAHRLQCPNKTTQKNLKMKDF